MAVTITQTTGTLAAATHGGAETELETGIESQGVYLYRLSLENFVGGATPDILLVREYMELSNGNGEQLLDGSPYVYQGGLAPALIELPTRAIPAGVGYRVTIEQTQGTDRDYPWARFEIG